MAKRRLHRKPPHSVGKQSQRQTEETRRLHHGPLRAWRHQDLVQALANAPASRLLQNEFVARYKAYIHRTVSRAVYDLSKTHSNAILRDMVEDIVNEVFFRVFRNDCRVLQGVEAQYESSIFAYLRSMCLNMVRNFMRDYFIREPLAHRHNTRVRDEGGAPRNLLDEIPAENDQTQGNSVEEACLCAAEIWHKQASFAQNMDRNLIIFKLHCVYGYHYDEIARIKGLELGESGVGNTIARLKHRLQNAAAPRERLLH